MTFAMVPDAAWPGSDQWPWRTAPATGPVGRLGRPSVSDQWGVGSFLSLGRPTCVRCPGPLGSCSPVCLLGALCCVCGVRGHFAPVHRCPRSVRSFACAVSLAPWLLFTGVLARFVVLRVRCPGPLNSCSPVRPLGVLCCVRGVLGHLAPVHQCGRLVCCFVCAVSWATSLLFTGVPARCVALRLQCPGPLGSCSSVRQLGALLCLCGVQGHLAPVHRCARVVCRVACAVSWAPWLPFTGAPARCVVLCVVCPRSLGSCSPVYPLGVLLCVCGVLGHLAPVHWCAWPRCPIPLLSLVLVCAQCPGPGGACSPACPLCAVCCWWLCLSSSLPNVFFLAFSSLFFCFFGKNRQNKFFLKFFTRKGARVHCRHKHGQLVQWCNSVVFSGVCRRCFGGRAPGVRLARLDVHGYGSGWVWFGASLLWVLAGEVVVWAVGVGCGYVAPSAGLVRSQGLAVFECGSGWIRVRALSGLDGCDSCGLGFGVHWA